MHLGGINPTGHTTQVDSFRDRIPEYDPRSGDHYWIIVGTWKVAPDKWISGEERLLDYENLVAISAPGCFHCEKLYTPLLLKRRCSGTAPA